jgi:hypothetical protein
LSTTAAKHRRAAPTGLRGFDTGPAIPTGACGMRRRMRWASRIPRLPRFVPQSPRWCGEAGLPVHSPASNVGMGRFADEGGEPSTLRPSCLVPQRLFEWHNSGSRIVQQRVRRPPRDKDDVTRAKPDRFPLSENEPALALLHDVHRHPNLLADSQPERREQLRAVEAKNRRLKENVHEVRGTQRGICAVRRSSCCRAARRDVGILAKSCWRLGRVACCTRFAYGGLAWAMPARALERRPEARYG